MERKEVWLYRLLLPISIVGCLPLLAFAIPTQAVVLLSQLLVTLLGVFLAILTNDWFKIETKAEDALELKKDLLNELKKVMIVLRVTHLECSTLIYGKLVGK